MTTLNKIYRTLVGYRTRRNYWSCSDFARKVQEAHAVGAGSKPKFGTLDDFKDWRQSFETDHPIVYWITEEGFDIAQDIVYFIPDVYHNVYAKLHNIFISKTHVIPTDLPLGQWQECSTRIEHGLFYLVVDFVEGEKAHMHSWSLEEGEKPIKDKREAGLAYLDWEISLGDESPHQAKAAQELKDLYLWIKDVYPNRPDPYDSEIWDEYERASEAATTREEKRKALEDHYQKERAQIDEVTEKLVQIVRLRETMWT